MEEDKFIKIDNIENNTLIFTNFKYPIKYLNLDEISTLNFSENFHSNFFERTNRVGGGILLNYSDKDISFEVFSACSVVNVNLDLKYFKIGF